MNWWEFFFVMLVLLPVMVLWLGCIFDAISRPDLGGLTKLGWVLFILLFPIIGALIYIVTRPRVVVGPATSLDEVWSTPSPTSEERDRNLAV